MNGETLRIGSAGEEVDKLQKILKSLGYNVEDTPGKFDQSTRSGVMAFQNDHGLVMDGVVATDMWRALRRVNLYMTAPTEAAVPDEAPDPETAPARSPSMEIAPPFRRPILLFGAAGAYVALLQDYLTTLGIDPGAIDGIFGTRTRAAVIAFQTAAGLSPDGIVGSLTWAALDAATPTPHLGS